MSFSGLVAEMVRSRVYLAGHLCVLLICRVSAAGLAGQLEMAVMTLGNKTARNLSLAVWFYLVNCIICVVSGFQLTALGCETKIENIKNIFIYYYLLLFFN